MFVQIIEANRYCYNTGEEGNKSEYFALPRPIIARILRKHYGPRWQRCLILEQQAFVLVCGQYLLQLDLDGWLLKVSNHLNTLQLLAIQFCSRGFHGRLRLVVEVAERVNDQRCWRFEWLF